MGKFAWGRGGDGRKVPQAKSIKELPIIIFKPDIELEGQQTQEIKKHRQNRQAEKSRTRKNDGVER